MPDRIQSDVEEFHRSLDLFMGVGEGPGLRRQEITASLIEEEARETLEAITGHQVAVHYGPPSDRGPDLVNAIDGLCDLLATVCGAAVAFGVDLAPFWDEVHRTNMAKKGGPIRSDGKQLRPEGWEPPQLSPILELQEAEAAVDPEVRISNQRARDREEARRRSLLSLDQAA